MRRFPRSSLARIAIASVALLLAALAPMRARAQGYHYPTGTPEFIARSAGEHYSCALAGDGRAFCWGADWYGQLGADTVQGHCSASSYSRGACARGRNC